jgi:hypothetical protein
MRTITAIPGRARGGQFGLTTIFELTTLCAMLAATARLAGVVSSACLMGMAFAVYLGRGLVALVLLFLAMLGTVELMPANGALVPTAIVAMSAIAVCKWRAYSVDRRIVAAKSLTTPNGAACRQPTDG